MTEDERPPVDLMGLSCPLPLTQHDRVVMGHGSGGRMSHDLIRQLFLPLLGEAAPTTLDDAAVLTIPAGEGRLAITTDSHVVSPIFFPGGDIGRLAVCGTVNDLAMMGATPLYLTAAFVLEEGLPLGDLQRILTSMRVAAAEAGVRIVAGDTKVVEKGGADMLFINTTGVGIVPAGTDVRGDNAQPGDVVLVSGPIGDHGIAVMSVREGLTFDAEVVSDVAPLSGLVAAMLAGNPSAVHVLRDPTRGGLATTLNEIAQQSQVSIVLDEQAIPVRPAVAAACAMLGFDPLYIACEGRLVACVAASAAPHVLTAMHAHPYGRDAAVIGRVEREPRGRVLLATRIGGRRIVDMLTGDMLPRIC